MDVRFLDLSIFRNDFFKEEILFAWEITNPESKPFSQKVIPALYFDIIFPLDGYLIVDGDRVEKPFISPILTMPKDIQIGENSRLAGIRIAPEYFRYLTKIEPPNLSQTYNILADHIAEEKHKLIIE